MKNTNARIPKSQGKVECPSGLANNNVQGCVCPIVSASWLLYSCRQRGIVTMVVAALAAMVPSSGLQGIVTTFASTHAHTHIHPTSNIEARWDKKKCYRRSKKFKRFTCVQAHHRICCLQKKSIWPSHGIPVPRRSETSCSHPSAP